MSSPTELLSAWDWPAPPTAHAADSGLINQTWVLTGPDRPLGVLQRLNTEIFVPAVHEDIEAITTHLAARGLTTPVLMRTRSGDLWHTDDRGGAWRCLTWVGDSTVHKLTDAQRARSAGELVARFHAAVSDLHWDFRSVRPGAHDTDKHLDALRSALATHSGHRLYEEVAPLADRVFARWQRWKGPRELPQRIIHGDLKISNVRFAGTRAISLIDLDTLQWGTLDAELGDAFRSWCNPASEDAARARFDLGLFDAAIQGYALGARAHGPSEEEWASIVPGIERISLELAARFARDALEEAYFGWDKRHGTAGDHNLLRARGQLDLARTAAHAAPHAQRKLDQAR
jgi:Ser/Thr protein kinase RdoA (MazF antagonist)